MSDRACEGGRTLYRRNTEHMRECVECGVCVREDLVDHVFFGFKRACGSVRIGGAEGARTPTAPNQDSANREAAPHG